jgi:hypothetical protein
MKKILTFVLAISFFGSCYYNNAEDLLGTANCDTTNVTYSITVNKILTDYCTSCHSDASLQGGITLEGYDNVKKYVDNGSLIGSINQVGFSPMPKGSAKLSDCDISKIQKWISDGAPNN